MHGADVPHRNNNAPSNMKSHRLFGDSLPAEPKPTIGDDWPKRVQCFDGVIRVFNSHAEWRHDARARYEGYEQCR